MTDLREKVARAIAPIRHTHINAYNLKRAKVMSVDIMLADAAISAVMQDIEAPTTLEQVEIAAAAQKTSQGRPFNWVDAAMAVLKTRAAQYRNEHQP